MWLIIPFVHTEELYHKIVKFGMGLFWQLAPDTDSVVTRKLTHN